MRPRAEEARKTPANCKGEETDTVRASGAGFMGVSGGCVKLIVCAPFVTLNVLVTGVAVAVI